LIQHRQGLVKKWQKSKEQMNPFFSIAPPIRHQLGSYANRVGNAMYYKQQKQNNKINNKYSHFSIYQTIY